MAEPVGVVHLPVVGDPTRARATVAEALQNKGLAMTWADDWSGTATRGSKTAQRILGAMAQYFEVGVAVSSDPGGTVATLTRPSAGFSGGLLGRARAVKQFRSVATELEATFAAAGVLRPPTAPAEIPPPA